MAFRILPLIRAQFKLGLATATLLAALLLSVFPLFFGVQHLNASSSASFLERFVSMVGIVLLVPVFSPEQDEHILEVVSARTLPQIWLILIRLILSLICLFALITIIAFIMKTGACTFPFWTFIVGTSITALSLGAAGFAGSGLTNNVVIGYCISFALWFLNFTVRDKLGMWYLFSMVSGDFRPKYVLLPSAAFIIAATLLIRYFKTRLR